MPNLLTTAEVAQVLRVSPRTIERWSNDGLLRRFQIAPGTVRYRCDDILALVDGEKEPPTNGNDGTGGTAPSLETSPGGQAQHEPA